MINYTKKNFWFNCILKSELFAPFVLDHITICLLSLPRNIPIENVLSANLYFWSHDQNNPYQCVCPLGEWFQKISVFGSLDPNTYIPSSCIMITRSKYACTVLSGFEWWPTQLSSFKTNCEGGTHEKWTSKSTKLFAPPRLAKVERDNRSFKASYGPRRAKQWFHSGTTRLHGSKLSCAKNAMCITKKINH